ncbi:hypothetical protein Droror1_Dr00003361 [Drosera rotundifolia]
MEKQQTGACCVITGMDSQTPVAIDKERNYKKKKEKKKIVWVNRGVLKYRIVVCMQFTFDWRPPIYCGAVFVLSFFLKTSHKSEKARHGNWDYMRRVCAGAAASQHLHVSYLPASFPPLLCFSSFLQSKFQLQQQLRSVSCFFGSDFPDFITRNRIVWKGFL